MEVYQQEPVVNLSYRKEREWKWLAHTFRKEGNNDTRQALKWNPQGKRKKKATNYMETQPCRRAEE